MIAVLTATGDITDERRQEFILWSDALGLSMLVDALAHELPAGATESTVLGPFYVPGSPLREYGESMVVESGAGVPAWVYGRVLDVGGEPDRRRRGGRVAERRRHALRGPAPRGPGGPSARALPDPPGSDSYAFVAVRPVPYPIPDDGPVGRMLPPPAAIPGAPRTST